MDLADVRVFTEPQQGASYDELLAVAQRVDQPNFGALQLPNGFALGFL